MLTYSKHCKHCGNQYMYQASGNGCLNTYNDENYCPECKKAIIDTLNKIPIKFVEKWKKINDINYNEFLKPIKDDYLKNKEEKDKTFKEKYGVNSLANSFKIVHSVDSSNNKVEEYYKDWCYYHVEWDEKNPDNKTIYCMYEFNVLDYTYNDKWYYDIKEKYIPCSCMSLTKFEDISVKPMSQPSFIPLYLELTQYPFNIKNVDDILNEYNGIKSTSISKDLKNKL